VTISVTPTTVLWFDERAGGAQEKARGPVEETPK
jgi:hypothetical protein